MFVREPLPYSIYHPEAVWIYISASSSPDPPTTRELEMTVICHFKGLNIDLLRFRVHRWAIPSPPVSGHGAFNSPVIHLVILLIHATMTVQYHIHSTAIKSQSSVSAPPYNRRTPLQASNTLHVDPVNKHILLSWPFCLARLLFIKNPSFPKFRGSFFLAKKLRDTHLFVPFQFSI